MLLPATKYRDRQNLVRFFEDAVDRLRRAPGVSQASAVSTLPMSDVGTAMALPFNVEGQQPPRSEDPLADVRIVAPGYFETMKIALLQGRFLDERDSDTTARTSVINETMARHLFANTDPLGQHVRVGSAPNGPWMTIVGVIGDVRHGGLEEEPQPELYITYLQSAPVAPFIVLRTTGDPALLADTVRAEVRRIDKNIPLYDMRTMSTLRADALSTRRFILLIVGAFGVLALGLAAIGVYGVMSLIVSERTREVGVRLALGAEPSRLLTMVVGQATKLATIGVTIGVVAALALAPLLESQLYGVASIDPFTFMIVPVVLLVIAALAAAVPARKAMRIDPLAALRIE